MVVAPSFAVTVAVQYFLRGGVPRMQDIFPPSRISDLQLSQYGNNNDNNNNEVESINSTLLARLTWTAPGGDLTSGQASGYEIRCYTNRESLAEGTFSQTGIPVHASAVPRPSEPGSRDFATVTLPWANEVFYYGVVALDEDGNRGPVSNLVPVFAREAPSPAPQAELRQGNMSAASLPSTVLEAFEDNLMVYIISGCITGIALIILLVIVISLRISRRKSVKPKRDLIKEISSPTLIHSSSTIPGILKDSSHLSVLPKGSPGTFENSHDATLLLVLPMLTMVLSSGGYSQDYSGYPAPGEDVSWAILPTYTNSAFQVCDRAGFLRIIQVGVIWNQLNIFCNNLCSKNCCSLNLLLENIFAEALYGHFGRLWFLPSRRGRGQCERVLQTSLRLCHLSGFLQLLFLHRIIIIAIIQLFKIIPMSHQCHYRTLV